MGCSSYGTVAHAFSSDGGVHSSPLLVWSMLINRCSVGTIDHSCSGYVEINLLMNEMSSSAIKGSGLPLSFSGSFSLIVVIANSALTFSGILQRWVSTVRIRPVAFSIDD